MTLDLCGIAKGYAVDRMARVMADHGVGHALVSLDGELRACGARIDGRPWAVALGVLLLDRRDKHFRLTTAGARFLVYAQQMLELQREVLGVMKGATEPSTVSVRLGAIESILHSWLIPWIERLRKTNQTPPLR